MKTRRSLKRFLILLVLLLVVVAAGWTGAWYVVSGRLIAHEAAWEEARRAEGWTIRHDAPRRTGWPMAAGVAFDDLSVSGGQAYLPGGLAWTATSLTLALDIRHPNELSLAVSGRQSLSLAGRPPLAFQARRMRGAAALLPGDRLGLMQGEAEGVLAAVPVGGKPAAASIARLALAAQFDGGAGAGAPALLLAGELHGIHLPPSHIAALGNPAQLAFDLAFSGPVPARAAQSSAEANAAAWSRAGGRMTLRRFHLQDGPLTLEAEGGFALDADLQIGGQVQARAQGLDQTLTRLAEAGVMTAPEARSMAAMFGLLAHATGQGAALALPVSLHDGKVSLGPIPLLHLRP